MLRIRFATADDASTIHALIQALADFEREPDAVECTPEMLRRQLASERPPFECLLAEYAGTIGGFALFFSSYSTWKGACGIYLEDLFVVPEQRGRGIGKALLAALARLALERGCRRLEWAVVEWNRPAIDFYRALGAEPLDEWTSFRLSGAELEALAHRAGARSVV